MRSSALTLLLFLVVLAAAPRPPKDPLEPILARMDSAANDFRTMTARITSITHTDVINEDSNPETGTVVMQKVRAGEVQGLINILSPDKRTIAFESPRLRIYYPNINTVQEWNLGKHGEQLDQFLRIGFGTSGTALAKDYAMNVAGSETIKGSETVTKIRLRLIPKAGEVRQYVKELELWIPETGAPYPVQEKISAPSGDYRLIAYSDLQINTPLKADALQLKLPAGFKTVYPGK